MMVNLFSIFDPISSFAGLSLNWLGLFLGLLLLPLGYWLMFGRFYFLKFMIMKALDSEGKVMMGQSYSSGATLLFISLFFFILFNNSLGLMPYVFTSTSHMAVTFSLSLTLWISFMFYGWLTQVMMMFSHLVPQGTPINLVSFMVLIETVSNVIRPLTLAVRLAANMIAGHLLLSLLGSQGVGVSTYIFFFVLMSQVLLLLLESAVAMIQSYVFMVLSVLYSSEVY